MTPKLIGPWKLGERLRRGGQGGVFRATRDEGMVAAVKVIELTRPKKRARFIQELKIHALLSAKGASNVIPVLDHNLEQISGSENAVRGYIAMPLAVCSLYDRYRLYNLRTEFCLETFLGIVTGIREAHQQGAIHRDIKPANVLFLDDSFKQPMVSDFGICFLKETIDSDRVTEHGETVGARSFMAPEQERGGVTDVTESSDIYALGKLLHFMITSRRLYRENLSEAFEINEIRADERLEIVRDDLLARMIVEDPSKRIQSADEVLEITSKILGAFRHRR
jgi:serine/threonine protein kinase